MSEATVHSALMPLAAAAARTPGVGFVYLKRHGGAWPQSLARVIDQLRLAAAIWRGSANELIIVREFGTLQFCIAALLVLPVARRVLLVNAHNLQRAKDAAGQRVALRALLGLGFRLVVLETAAGAEAILGRQSRAIVVLPHPGAPEPVMARPASSPPVVGMVGDFRSEKAMLRHAATLVEAGRILSLDVRFGTASAEAREALGDRAVDTGDPSAYRAFLASCDVLVVPYPRESYEFRASGIVADAFNLGTPVIVTALPALSRQALHPATGGICLDPDQIANPTILAGAIARLLERRAEYAAGARTNAAVRDETALAGLLGELLAGAGGNPRMAQPGYGR
jgi:glycosyltransferase involved in cell wall biosynthesis